MITLELNEHMTARRAKTRQELTICFLERSVVLADSCPCLVPARRIVDSGTIYQCFNSEYICKLEYHLESQLDLSASVLLVTAPNAVTNRCMTDVPSQTRSFQALVGMVEDDRLAQSRQSELVRREKEATQAVKKLEADLFSERADHFRQVSLSEMTDR